MKKFSTLAAAPSDKVPAPARVGKRTQEQRRSDAEMRLLDSAREIVAHKGWVGMTLAEVGSAAGYSRGLAAHHFGSKPELLRALAVHIGQNFMSNFSADPARREGFHAVLEFIQAYLGREGSEWTNTRALLILMAEGSTDESEAGANLSIYNQSVIDFLARHFRESMAKKEIHDDIDPVSAAVALLGTVRGIMLQKLLKNSTIDLKVVTHAVMLSTIRGYARRPQTWLVLYTGSGG